MIIIIIIIRVILLYLYFLLLYFLLFAFFHQIFPGIKHSFETLLVGSG